VALSRVVLGLHYPSDVLAGAALGALIAYLSFWF
jgi:undecaprenyl-diphosphatase